MAGGIKNAMQIKGISVEAVAAVIQVHRNSATNKINGITQFTVEEAFKLKSTLFPEYDVEYLFADPDIAQPLPDTG